MSISLASFVGPSFWTERDEGIRQHVVERKITIPAFPRPTDVFLLCMLSLFCLGGVTYLTFAFYFVFALVFQDVCAWPRGR